MSDSLLNMKAFVATARAGSFSEAARQLRLAPSVVTKRVTQLEWSLKSKLLRRSTRRLQLTEVGERYLETMQQIVREYDEMAAGVKRSPDEIEGLIRIKAPGSPMAIDLSGLLAAFQIKYPRVTLDAVLVDRTVNPVEEGFDIVLTMMPSSFHGVIEEPLLAYPRVLCAAPSYIARRGQPRHVRDLADHDCLVFTPMGQVWTFDGKSGLTTVAVRPRLVTNNNALLVEALSAGGGIAVVSRTAMTPRLRSGALVEVLPDVLVPDLWVKALVPSARANLARVQTLLAAIRDAFRVVGESQPAQLVAG
ncbi:transcriptional regulator [Bradyrhizobium sp. SSBR45G]|uniref:LysR family transcriptional regulator n=1 Tax=unclassified Bradyrhizobium TaxID=2631580 RepID=UPI002342A338|nr:MULTISPECIES: LysR family transcriptional regulator [unclassified Bradyrhizobium]GLH75172.1 transcriptional regulator [Bradyrhizobium sp. SSBR45G]GLH83041.1 transcriptional regulator [Bradyrhizobium sp. SSBR45R]